MVHNASRRFNTSSLGGTKTRMALFPYLPSGLKTTLRSESFLRSVEYSAEPTTRVVFAKPQNASLFASRTVKGFIQKIKEGHSRS